MTFLLHKVFACTLFPFYSEDGDRPGFGTVTEIGNPSGGWVSIRWDNGEIWDYRMGFYGRFDISLADEA